MLYFPRLLSLLINIDQETVLNWFGLENKANQEIFQTVENGYDLNVSKCKYSLTYSYVEYHFNIRFH